MRTIYNILMALLRTAISLIMTIVNVITRSF